MTLLSFQCSEGSVDPGKVWKERIYWRKLSPDILLRLLSILCSILCQQSTACTSMHTAYLTLFDVSHQTCLSQHFGRRAKTTSSILRGYSCCPVKTSLSNTSSRRMLVVFLLYYHLIFISVPYFWLYKCLLQPNRCSQRLPKLSSPWRTWMQFSNQRRSVMRMDCRSHIRRRNKWGICLFIMRTGRWVSLLLQGNVATKPEQCLVCSFFLCLFALNMLSMSILCLSVLTCCKSLYS